MEGSVFWDKVKFRLKELGRRQDWLALRSGILLQTMRNKIHLKKAPSLADSMAIVKALGLTWEEFERYPDAYCGPKAHVLTIPVLDQASAIGDCGGEMPGHAEAREYVAVPSELQCLREHVFAAYVHGDSMEPTFFDGDTIIYDMNGYDGSEGMYTIVYAGTGCVKRLQQTTEGVRILSDNKNYEPVLEPCENDGFRVIGRVRYVIHRV